MALPHRLHVATASETRGHVRFLGVRVPYTSHTQCQAICRLDIMTLAVHIIEQRCDTKGG